MTNKEVSKKKFKDLNRIPLPISFMILKNLSATDLCVAGCIWPRLCANEQLWRNLSLGKWKSSTRSPLMKCEVSWRQFYLLLDEGTLAFNVNWKSGINFLIRNRVIGEDREEIVEFVFNQSPPLSAIEKGLMMENRRDLVEHLVRLNEVKNSILPNTLRCILSQFEALNGTGDLLHAVILQFSEYYASSNQHLQLTSEEIYILCYSLMLLSIDLTCDYVKNKMSKREFIRNTYNALTTHVNERGRMQMNERGDIEENDGEWPNEQQERRNRFIHQQRMDMRRRITNDFIGHLYDNVYLLGHIAIPLTTDILFTGIYASFRHSVNLTNSEDNPSLYGTLIKIINQCNLPRTTPLLERSERTVSLHNRDMNMSPSTYQSTTNKFKWILRINSLHDSFISPFSKFGWLYRQTLTLFHSTMRRTLIGIYTFIPFTSIIQRRLSNFVVFRWAECGYRSFYSYMFERRVFEHKSNILPPEMVRQFNLEATNQILPIGKKNDEIDDISRHIHQLSSPASKRQHLYRSRTLASLAVL
ncbi:hypothetical protein SNEBB_000568 [Seison nebaliae]|nr:hypothetical protein SNEBB_000568 [Seison nebaliae]